MEDICGMGHNPNIVCSRSAVKAKTPAANQSQATNGDDTSSDDEDEEDEVPTSVREQESKMVAPIQVQWVYFCSKSYTVKMEETYPKPSKGFSHWQNCGANPTFSTTY